MWMDHLTEGWESKRKCFSAMLTNMHVMRNLIIVH